MSSSPHEPAIGPSGPSVASTGHASAALIATMRASGFTACLAWVSADTTSALGDTGWAASATVRMGDFPCDIAAATPLLRKVLAMNAGGPAAVDLVAATEPWWESLDIEKLATPVLDAGARALWLFLVPFTGRCAFCLAASPRNVDRAGVDAAFGVLTRHFAAHMARNPVRPPFAADTYADRFSARERDILHWCSKGKTNWEVSQILDLSENTVRFHLKKIFKKLDVSTRSAAIGAALARGVIEPALSQRKSALTEMYRSFVEGDAGPLRALLADDVVMVATAPTELFAHAGRYEGPEGVLAHAAAVDREYACRRFLPRMMAEDGDEVAVYLEVEILHRATGRPMCFDCAHFWTFRDDKIVHYVELFNTAHAHQQRSGIAPENDDRTHAPFRGTS